ncbi:glycoside hydrolase family 10 protein [Kitasatospora indigofera]|uniref:glycoside hydrolase family 10 protein n=1 Tax=Kitasatospora indigofera TaxID=67307 RepID=UPI0036AA895C
MSSSSPSSVPARRPSAPSRRTVLSALAVIAAGAGAGLPAAGRGYAADGAAAATGPKAQLRGVWIASVVNIDWPSAPGLAPERLRTDFLGQLDRAVARGLNAVFVQIRPTADAFWPSPYEPWSQWITGVQGQDPGWDPLDFMVRAAHERGLAFHAWFNPYRVSMQPDVTLLVAGHPARVNPGWTVTYGGKLYYNPGVPAARRFAQQAMLDAVRRYDIDGVHFDDYFYPYPVSGQDFPDDEAFAAHGEGWTDRAAWRRHNVDLMVSEMQQLVREARPEAYFGISPFGVWRNDAGDPAGSATKAFQSYDGLNADTRGWVAKGWLDYIAPQLYWHIGLAVADYGKLAPWWAAQTAGTDTLLWIGQAVYKVADPAQPAPWQDPAELSRHLDLNATLPQVSGDILFSAKDTWADRIGSVSRLHADHWQRPALVPLLPRLAGGAVPRRPALRSRQHGADGLDIDSPGHGADGLDTDSPGHGARPAPFRYAVYRYDADPGPRPGLDAAHLVALVPAAVGRFQEPAGVRDAWYVVTAVDRVGRESRPSAAVRTRAPRPGR